MLFLGWGLLMYSGFEVFRYFCQIYEIKVILQLYKYYYGYSMRVVWIFELFFQRRVLKILE